MYVFYTCIFLRRCADICFKTCGSPNTHNTFGESFPKNLIVNPQGMISYYSEGGHENKYLDIDNELKKQMDNK